jgi:hypothetical protein
LMFIFFSSFAINAHGEHLFCAEVILQWWHWQQNDDNNNKMNTMVLAMGVAVNVIKGWQLHTTIKWWGCVCGEHFFARKFNYNDDVDGRMTTTTMMGIHGVGNGGCC